MNNNSYYDINSTILSNCVELIDKIFMKSVFIDSSEIKNTFYFARNTLVSYNIKKIEHLDFNFLLEQIKNMLISFLVVIEKNIICFKKMSCCSEKSKLKIFEMDYTLNLQLRQLIFIFPIDKNLSDSSPNLTNESANNFWINNFGKDTKIVPCNIFLNKITTLEKKRKIILYFLDFTQDKYISIYEFEILTSIFGFGELDTEYFTNLIDAYNKNLFFGFISGYKAEILILGELVGTFIIRVSKSDPNNLAITHVSQDHKIKHCLLYVKFGQFTLKSPPSIHKSLQQFVDFYNMKLIYPIGVDLGIEKTARKNHCEYHTKLKTDDNILSKNFSQTKSDSEYDDSSELSLPYNSPITRPLNSINSPNFNMGSCISTNLVIKIESESQSNHNHCDSKHVIDCIPDHDDFKNDKDIMTSDELIISGCIVCCNNKRNVLFMNCKHMLCCDTCSEKINECPICKTNIIKKIKIFTC